jgi:oleandomycin transport system permease protein
VSPTRAARHGLTLAWRSLLKIRHSPDQLLDVLLMPITFVVVFVFLFGKAVAGDWHAYLQFVLPGIAVQALLFASMGTRWRSTPTCEPASSTGSAACRSPARRR